MTRDRWVWMPHPGHLIVSRDCRFHLNTYVGGYIVSTLGEYLPDAPVREINASVRGITLEGRGDARLADYMNKCGYQTIGFDRLYESMVFKAAKAKDGCCPYSASDFQEKECVGYNDAGAALAGHLKLCAKWARGRAAKRAV